MESLREKIPVVFEKGEFPVYFKYENCMCRLDKEASGEIVLKLLAELDDHAIIADDYISTNGYTVDEATRQSLIEKLSSVGKAFATEWVFPSTTSVDDFIDELVDALRFISEQADRILMVRVKQMIDMLDQTLKAE